MTRLACMFPLFWPARRRQHRLLTEVVLAALLVLASQGYAAPLTAGTPVVNQATGSFNDVGTGLNVRLNSNTVSTVTQPLEAMVLTTSQWIGRAPGSLFVLPHQLTNTGNVMTTSTVSLVNSPQFGASFVPGDLTVVLDANGNGVADSGEPVLGAGSSLAIVPGATLNLLVIGAIPLTAAPGDVAKLRLTSFSQANVITGTNTDTISVVNGAAVTVVKAPSTTSPVQGSTLGYNIQASNIGTLEASPSTFTVDGAPASLFLLSDSIPANTTFRSISSNTPAAKLLYHRLGDDPRAFVSVIPVGVQIDRVGWALTRLVPGGTLTGTLNVLVHANAAGSLANTARVEFFSEASRMSVLSNPVLLRLPALAPKISFFPSDAYGKPVGQSLLGTPLFVEFEAAQCNTDPTKILTQQITLVSKLTGDTETFTATETAPNTGVFRILPNVPTASATVRVVATGDGILELLHNDQITASIAGCGAGTATSTLLIDPSGIVFDSKTNTPIAGATVRLVNLTTGLDATVYAADGVTPAPSSVITTADGSYYFPFVDTGTYKLVISAPNGYRFPSVLPIGLMPAGRTIDTAGSYGNAFTVSLKGGPVTIDIPMDAGAASGLFLQKTASKTVAEIGDFVSYTLTLNNNTGSQLTAGFVIDTLPVGFSYIRGSVRLNGVATKEPAGGVGPSLMYDIGAVASGTPVALTYRVSIGPGAATGTGINSAFASSGPTKSNVATARVQVTGGIMSDKAFLFGKVYADCDGNRVQDDNEPGVPGVRLYLDNGMYAITGLDGKYSMAGLTPRTYTAKVDAISLPQGATLQVLANRNGGDPASRFVDVKRGELHKADFAIVECGAPMRALIQDRHAKLARQPNELDEVAANQMQRTSSATADVRALPANGIFGRQSADQRLDATNAKPAVFSAPVSARKLVLSPQALQDWLSEATPDVGFIDLVDGQVMPSSQTRVRVKGPLVANLSLVVNSVEVSEKQVGEKSCLDSVGTCALDFIGVNLKAGKNSLVLKAVDDFGNVRGKSSIQITAPGDLAKVRITAPRQAVADPLQPIQVLVQLFDQNEVPVTSRQSITLESSAGAWDTADLNSNERGTQVFVEGGEGQFRLIPPQVSGKAFLRASAAGAGVGSALRVQEEVVFVPELRPLIAAGLIEGVLSLRNLSHKNIFPSLSVDAFEREIKVKTESFDSGRGAASARASVFLKGKVLGSSLLTLSYDSDKPADGPLLRAIEPDKFYPVYGDSSIKGYEAQSTSKLYVRLDHGTSSALYGDFSTQTDNSARVLGQYNRVLNGAKFHYASGNFVGEGFLSNTNSTQVIDELSANGTSGPFRLSQTGAINSQLVEVITRDRNQASIVLKAVPMTALSDYVIESLSGQLLFKAPIPSVDADLNPISVRVSYEVSAGGANYFVGGVEGRQTLFDGFVLGGLYVRDANPLNRSSLFGANATWALDSNTTLTAEYARTASDLVSGGDAARFELNHTDLKFQVRAYAVQTSPEFNNPNSTFTAGASEYGVKGGYALNDKARMVFEALRSTTSGNSISPPPSVFMPAGVLPMAGGARREIVSIGTEYSLPMDAKVTLLARHQDTNDGGTVPGAVETSAYTSLRGRFDVPLPGLPTATVFAQYEQVVGESDRRAATVGGTYQLAPQTKLYATHELTNSLAGENGLTGAQQAYSTVVGIDTTYMKNGQMFDEYRVRDGLDGRSAQAAIGLRNQWELAQGLSLNTTAQQIVPLFGPRPEINKSVALTGALAYTADPDWKGSVRLEWSKSADAQNFLATAGVAVKLNPEMTLLSRGLYNQRTNASEAVSRLTKLQLGLAYRPADSNAWNGLARVERNHAKNLTAGAATSVASVVGLDEASSVLSVHVNYQPTAQLTLSGRYGAKRTTDFSNGITSSYTTQLIGGRAIWDLRSRWDFSLQHFVEFGGTDGSLGASNRISKQQAIGAELGYMVTKNLWLSAGYNVQGFRDAELVGEDYTQRGGFVRLRFKFDENLFKSGIAEPLPAPVRAVP